MNRDKWKRCNNASRLMVKLAEETGEVAQAYLNAVEATDEATRETAKSHMLMELDHVHFIAECLEDLAGKAPTGYMNHTPDDDGGN